MSDADHTAATVQLPPIPLRLTIGLLLVWTTTTALTLGLASSLQRSRDDEMMLYRYPATYRQMLWIQDVLWFTASPAYGAALAAAAVVSWRAVRQIGGFPAQPGHWIAVLLGIATVGFFAAVVPSRDEPTQRVIATAVVAILAIVACLATSRTREPRRWRLALRVASGGLCGLVAVIVAGQAAELQAHQPALWVLVLLPAIAIAVSVVMAFAAATLDLLLRQRYDFFHWAGMVALAVLVAHPAIALAVFWYV